MTTSKELIVNVLCFYEVVFQYFYYNINWKKKTKNRSEYSRHDEILFVKLIFINKSILNGIYISKIR